MGIAEGLNIAARALNAYQIAMQTMGHNISNANTDGYSRQQARLVATDPTIQTYGAVGTGVEVADITRVRDQYLDLQMYREQGVLGSWQEREDALQKIELYFNEPSSAGLNNLINEFWNSWQDVSNNPSDQTSRISLLQKATQVTDTINSIDSKMNQLRLSLDEVVQEKVTYVNSLAEQIASLNEQIISFETDGHMANDLRDRRDVLKSELAQLVDFTTHEQPNGASAIFIDGEALVWNTEVNPLELERDFTDELSIQTIKWSSNNKDVAISSGEIGGLLYARDTVVPDYIAKLDELAQAMIEEINRVHAGGVGLSGFSSLTGTTAVSDQTAALDSSAAGLTFPPQSGTFTIHVKDAGSGLISDATVTVTAGVTTLESLRDDINTAVTAAGGGLTASIANSKLVLSQDDADHTFAFSNDSSDVLLALGVNTFFTGTNAETIGVNSMLESTPGLIAAGRYDSGTDVDFNPGDNSNVIDIIGVRTALTMSSQSTSFDDYYNTELIGSLGVATNEATRIRENQALIVEQVQTRIDEKSGVSIDEEMASLIQYQHAYTAAARYMSVVGQALDELVNIL